jgi:hypothetical protein
MLHFPTICSNKTVDFSNSLCYTTFQEATLMTTWVHLISRSLPQAVENQQHGMGGFH